MVTRDFDAMLAARAGVRPTFKVGGQEFTVKAKLPFKKFQKLVASLAGDDIDEEAKTEEFFRMVLIPQDRERFFLLLNYDGEGDEVDEWNVVSPEQINGLTEWLMELYTGKAGANSPSSSNGSDDAGQRQNVVSLTSRTQSA